MSAAYRALRYDVTDSVATVTFHRPERLNAFNDEMGHELMDALDRIDGDDAVRAAVFTGSGRGYCAGADLDGGGTTFDRGDEPDFDMAQHADFGGTIARRLFDATKPLIAAVNGPAVGVGASTLLPMDIRLASTAARFGFVFTRRGLVPESCSAWFLPRIVGMSTAAEWVYSGRVFDADEALARGLVRSLHEPEDLLPAAHRLAHELTDHSSAVSVALSRRMMWRLLDDGDVEQAHIVDSHGIFVRGRSDDMREGVAAFLEKRPARFPQRVSDGLPDLFGPVSKHP